ncbi:MAG TPA: hypothetical protein VJ279_07070 [Hanamia sp.]|nr:hypothetical protein [Hanamia sp.]
MNVTREMRPPITPPRTMPEGKFVLNRAGERKEKDNTRKEKFWIYTQKQNVTKTGDKSIGQETGQGT